MIAIDGPPGWGLVLVAGDFCGTAGDGDSCAYHGSGEMRHHAEPHLSAGFCRALTWRGQEKITATASVCMGAGDVRWRRKEGSTQKKKMKSTKETICRKDIAEIDAELKIQRDK